MLRLVPPFALQTGECAVRGSVFPAESICSARVTDRERSGASVCSRGSEGGSGANHGDGSVTFIVPLPALFHDHGSKLALFAADDR
jgi:hypothetical protein